MARAGGDAFNRKDLPGCWHQVSILHHVELFPTTTDDAHLRRHLAFSKVNIAQRAGKTEADLSFVT